MEPEKHIQTSFIPKRSMSEKTRHRRSIGFFSLVGIVIFILAAGFWGGSYFYKINLEGRTKTLEASLERAEGAFENDTLEIFIDLDRKLKSARLLLDQHTTIVPLLNHLEETTLRKVRFKNFSYESNPDGALVSMSGEADSYETVALQSDEFGRSNYIRNPIFSGIDLDRITGNVIFSVDFSVDPVLISYTNNIE